MSDFVKELQQLLQKHGEALPKFGADGVWGAEGQEALDRLLSAKPQTIEIPDDYWPMLSKIESADRPYVKAPTSSASGLFQFIKATWENEGGTWGPDLGQAFGGLRPTVEEQLRRAKTFTAKNAKILANAGLPINRASLYAAHFLGPMGAVKLIAAPVATRIEAVTSPGQRRANPSILGGDKTVADFLSWLHKKTGAWAR